MPRLLNLDASADLVRSRSRAITATFRAGWQARGDDFEVVERDLHRDPPPHLPDAALHWPPELRPDGAEVDPEAERRQQELIDELLSADVLIVGAPLYNWSLPSTLKAWIDHIHVPGVTAALGDERPPLAGRPAVVVSPRGGIYDPGTRMDGWDHGVPALEVLLGGALGMEVAVITASRTLAGVLPALADQADRGDAELAAAHATAARLAAELPVAPDRGAA